MSAKAQFLKKLQDQQPGRRDFDSKSEADIAELRLRMDELQEMMDAWLAGTGICIESYDVVLSDLLAGRKTFSVTALKLHYDNREIKFTPVYLYGQGVTGCVEVSLWIEGRVTPQYRLFMRCSESINWTCSPAAIPGARRRAFSEDAFFEMITGLLA
ncbi:hypothetical protein MUU46_15975 [Scandinavium sp. TWS1a]|uniref:hypothetical protein n=1 Tax=Scandinavium tedordense TaxID=2926521 RepID=UPI0021655835|nr:hypothetical protein [Scandinavium tedordense]MCS2171801.1 hypothetical protein [Scandinavium tedordense]